MWRGREGGADDAQHRLPREERRVIVIDSELGSSIIGRLLNERLMSERREIKGRTKRRRTKMTFPSTFSGVQLTVRKINIYTADDGRRSALGRQ